MDAARSGDDAPLATPPRFWTVDEANTRLDELRELLPRLKAWGSRLQKLHAELQRLTEFWGKELDAVDHPDKAHRERLSTEWATVGEKLRAELERLHAEGIEVKDVDTGLVDFYAYEAGEVVLLCWQHGEDRVAFYHTLEGGYRSRRPIGSLPTPPRTPSHRPVG
jgi:hypothetical protein